MSGSESTRCLRLGTDVEEEDTGWELGFWWEEPAAVGFDVGGGMDLRGVRMWDSASGFEDGFAFAAAVGSLKFVQ